MADLPPFNQIIIAVRKAQAVCIDLDLPPSMEQLDEIEMARHYIEAVRTCFNKNKLDMYWGRVVFRIEKSAESSPDRNLTFDKM